MPPRGCYSSPPPPPLASAAGGAAATARSAPSSAAAAAAAECDPPMAGGGVGSGAMAGASISTPPPARAAFAASRNGPTARLSCAPRSAPAPHDRKRSLLVPPSCLFTPRTNAAVRSTKKMSRGRRSANAWKSAGVTSL